VIVLGIDTSTEQTSIALGTEREIAGEARFAGSRKHDDVVPAIERLLDSATVQAETSGVLRQTLENLRVFQYESMEGDLRVQGTGGHVDLSLRGRKRLGIFPAAVEAINFRNVPLSVLARTLGRSHP